MLGCFFVVWCLIVGGDMLVDALCDSVDVGRNRVLFHDEGYSLNDGSCALMDAVSGCSRSRGDYQG